MRSVSACRAFTFELVFSARQHITYDARWCIAIADDGEISDATGIRRLFTTIRYQARSEGGGFDWFDRTPLSRQQ